MVQIKRKEAKAKPEKAAKAAPKKAGRKVQVAIQGKKEKVESGGTALAWMERMNAERRFQGHAQIKAASDMKTPYSLRRPSGILSLDIALGGGCHAGAFIEVQGIRSAGKTYLTYRFAAMVQEIYGEDAKIAVYATEQRPDKSFARMAGFCVAYSEDEIAHLNQIRIDSGQNEFTEEELADLRHQIGEVVYIVADTAESGLEVALEAIRSNIFQILIVDSLGGLMTKAVEEGDIMDKQYGGVSVPMTTFVNKAYALLMMDDEAGLMNETTIIGINQARAKIGATKYERSERPAMGAHAWQHAQLANILLERGAQIKEGEKGPAIGREIRFKLEKGKVGTHDGKNGVYNFYHIPRMEPVFWKDTQENWYGGVDVYTDIVETCIELGVIEKAGKGAWITWKHEKEELKFQGIAKAAKYIGENTEVALALRENALKKAKVSARFK